jgi:hypothetical protein
MTHVLFANTQAFGDVILGINAARRYKENNPDHLVSYCLRSNFMLTTHEQPSGISEVLEVISKQPWLDSIGLIEFDNRGQVKNVNLNKSEEQFKKVDKMFLHWRWFSDLGISKSANLPIKEYITEDQFLDGNTILNIDSVKPDDKILRIGMSGPLDWNRKLQSETMRLDIIQGIREILNNKNIEHELSFLGIECGNFNLYQSLQILKRQDLFISPLGSLVHASAAMNVNTISIPSVFPIEYDSPEFYSDGYHKTIKPSTDNHCGDFKCIVPKLSKDADTNIEPGNPTANFTFWPRHCPHTSTSFACTKTHNAESVLEEFKNWLDIYNDNS